MSNVAIIARITTKDGLRDQVIAEMASMFDQVATEEGTLAYTLHTVGDDPNAIVFYELYSDMAAVGVHSGSAAMAALGKVLADKTEGRPEITLLSPVRGKA